MSKVTVGSSRPRKAALKGALAACFIGLPTRAFAHPGHGQEHSFLSGLSHPLGGIDHILVMIAVGILAAQIGGSARWRLPLTFIGMMIIGGLLGMSGMILRFVELGIATSVAVLCVSVALRRNPAKNPACMMVGLFAVFHGLAHGIEMPPNADGLSFGAGFVLAAAFLHGIGSGMGRPWRRDLFHGQFR